MSRLKILFHVLQQVVADQGSEFFTKDVSEDDRMRNAHLDLIENLQYHGFVGGALSDHDVPLGIRKIGFHQKRGSIWKKTTNIIEQASDCFDQRLPQSDSVFAQQIEEQEKINFQFDLGPQYAQDNILARRMRKHQSWYRSAVLNLPYGTGPVPNSTCFYGNMLTRMDGEAGLNFLSSEIFQVVQERIARGYGAIERFRLLHNMLSSQPMCFNLFGPLVKDLNLAKALLETIVPERISEVIRVDIEWSPIPINEYLNDRTAFDAFVEYRTTDRQLIGLGIETKLSEPFSQKEYDRPEYRRWMLDTDSPWLSEAWDKVQAIGHNQLWREHLLAVAMNNQPGSAYSKVRLMLVHHDEDVECARNFSNYKNLLKENDDTLLALSLDQIVARWLSAVKQEKHKEWLKAFKKRYVDLELNRLDRQ